MPKSQDIQVVGKVAIRVAVLPIHSQDILKRAAKIIYPPCQGQLERV